MSAPRLMRFALLLAFAAIGRPVAGQAITVRNNYDLPYRGAVAFAASVPDGSYAARGDGRAGEAWVRAGLVSALVDLPPRSEIVIHKSDDVARNATRRGFTIRADRGALSLLPAGAVVAKIEYGLVAIADTTASVDDAVRRFEPLDLRWHEVEGGGFAAAAAAAGYSATISATPALDASVDFRARVWRDAASTGGKSYLALIRRVTTDGSGPAALRFNGRRLDAADSPEIWDRDFWYTHGVDWISWKTNAGSVVAVNGFAPVPPVARGAGWREGSHFWVWEKTRRVGDAHYLVSEIAGPNRNQSAVTQYAPLAPGDTVTLTWRLAATETGDARWQESQLAGFAGPRFVSTNAHGATVDLGVRHVTFGVSYFPYSTLSENFDYYRTPGLNKEGFWAFSPVLWSRWRELVPRMRTDLHIIHAMGFERIRLHHLELVQKMDRQEALAFLDFLIGEARSLDMRVLIDSDGPADWLALLAQRYGHSLVGIELENEVLISGIPAGGPARWKNLYVAVKAVSPGTEVFLTGVGNNGMFERIRGLGVPFDRVGLHAYKHGPQWKEAFASHMLGTASYASSLGLPVTLGEFNWKDLTKMSPPERMTHYTEVYEQVLGTRSIPDVYHFQFQESLSFNPAFAGTFSRHYETLRVDRRPKPEAFELMRLVRKYSAPAAPANQLRISVPRSRLARGAATAEFSVTNTAGRAIDIRLSALAFDGVSSTLAGRSSLRLQPGESRRVSTRVATPPGARVGTYHHFLKASFDSVHVIGWGVAAIEGAPTFDRAPLLADRVVYPHGAASVLRLDWRRPIAVIFGKDASVLELETAYAVTNTLQSATGKDIWLSSESDLPDSLAARALVVVVGTPQSSTLVRARNLIFAADKGSVIVDAGNRPRVFLAGNDKTHAQAAAVEFLLRYWKNAKDSMIRLTGMERGAALGNRIPGVVVDPP